MHRPALSRGARVIALIATVTFAAAVGRVAYVLQPLRWPTTTGRITRSEQVQVYVGMYGGRTSYHPMYEPRFHLAYVYRVGNEPITGTRIDDVARDGRRYVLTGTSRFPVGSAVTVRYDPGNHARAVLEVGVPWGAMTSAILSIAALVLALLPASRKPVRLADEDDIEGAEEPTLLSDPPNSESAAWGRAEAEQAREDPTRIA